MNIIVRSILIAFLVAIPSPFLLGWLAGIGEINSDTSIYIGVYFMAFVACMIMGLTSKPAKTAVKHSAPVETAAGDEADDREQGTVKWFNVTKGFGFITRDSGEDVFVHYRSVRGNGRRTLREGQRVLFNVVQGEKGLQAEDVSVAE